MRQRKSSVHPGPSISVEPSSNSSHSPANLRYQDLQIGASVPHCLADSPQKTEQYSMVNNSYFSDSGHDNMYLATIVNSLETRPYQTRSSASSKPKNLSTCSDTKYIVLDSLIKTDSCQSTRCFLLPPNRKLKVQDDFIGSSSIEEDFGIAESEDIRRSDTRTYSSISPLQPKPRNLPKASHRTVSTLNVISVDINL